MSLPFAQKIIQILQDYCDSYHQGNVRAASRELGIDPDSGYLSRWLKCFDSDSKTKRIPRIDNIGPCMDKLGVRLLLPGEVLETHNDKPESMDEVPRLRARITELEAELVQMRTERDKALGAAEVLRDMIEKNSNHSARDSASDPLTSKPSSSNSRTG